MRPGRYNEVIYKEAMTLAAQVYDFKVCQRGDGSYYGTSDSNKCRVGTESSKPEKEDKEVSREEVTKAIGLKGQRLKTAEPLLDKLSDEEFGRVTQAAAELIGVKPTPKVGMMTGEEHDLLIKNEKKLLELLEADKQANEVRKIIELHSHREKSLKRKPTDESSMQAMSGRFGVRFNATSRNNSGKSSEYVSPARDKKSHFIPAPEQQ